MEMIVDPALAPQNMPAALDINASSSSNPPSPSGKPCFFFGNGTCRNGDKCRFSHVPISPGSQPPPGAPTTPPGALQAPRSPGAEAKAAFPAPLIINLPLGHPVYSIDVECVATSVQHNGRSIAQVALVDEWSRLVFSVYVKQDLPVLSYITELTGLTKEILDEHGIPLGLRVRKLLFVFTTHSKMHFSVFVAAEALALLRAHLPPNAILVGQNIQKDVQWLQLAEGVDYFSLVDISGLFRIWNPQR